MSRYIDADKLKNHYAWWNDENKEIFDSIIDAQPTADVKEVVRGEWVERDEYYDDIVYRCSACRTDFCLFEGTPQENEWNFCPMCGADMRGSDAEP